MKIRILGAHNQESRDARVGGILIDGVLALDCGALTSTLTFEEQLNLQAVLITHHHYDHIKDAVMLGATFYNEDKPLTVYSTPSVEEALAYLFSYPGKLYTNLLEKPAGNPALRFMTIEPLKSFGVGDYEVLAVPVNHSVPAVGFQVTAADGKKMFYTGDTGPGLDGCWRHISPDLLIIENTASDRFIEEAREVKHLSPGLLKAELLGFQKIRGYLPRVITTHHFPSTRDEAERTAELERIARELNAPITAGYEGMEIEL